MNIGRVYVPSQLVLAPMAGVTDLAFRQICSELGAADRDGDGQREGAVLSATARAGGAEALPRRAPPASVQIFGSDPVCMAEAACLAAEISGADIVDINMGCPVGKIVSNGDGSALMRDPEKAVRVAEAVVRAAPVPVTVKMRRGWDKGSINAAACADARAGRRGGGDRPRTHARADVRRAGRLTTIREVKEAAHPGHRQRRRVPPGGRGTDPAVHWRGRGHDRTRLLR